MDEIKREEYMELSKPLLDYSLNDEKPFKCKVCAKSYSRSFVLTKHMKTHTKKLNKVVKSDALTCQFCQSKFASRRNLRNHEAVQHGQILKPSHQCPMCDKSFLIRDKLSRHIKRHSGVKKHQCDNCSKFFSDKSNLRTHINNRICQVTETHLPYHCRDCEEYFIDKGSLREHSKIHKVVQEFFCEECGMTFEDPCSLADHVKTHLKSKPFQCPECGNVFRLKCFVFNHMRRKHEVEPDKTKSYLRQND